MQSLEVVLARLGVTLWAACSVSACKPHCQEPVLDRNGQPTGFVRCSDGAINRESALESATPVSATACKGTETRRMCETDADCTEKPNGHCISHDNVGREGERLEPSCGCVYPCLNDSECGVDEACVYPVLGLSRWNAAACVPATCKTNSDCGQFGECGTTIYDDACHREFSLACRTSNDTCHSDKDCRADEDCRMREGIYQCQAEEQCKIGRPLTVYGGVRVAGLDGVVPTSERARYWLGVARMEHASVASFARFVHELLRFGAPPQLIADALAAAADEVRHAEQTFAIASAYAGAPLGPSGLRVDDIGPTDDPELFVTRLITEGCVGETLGVAEVLALLDGDLDPRLRPCLEQIAADETRHAALAWRTLRWFAPRVDPAAIERAFERAIRSAEQVGDEPSEPRHGRLGRDATRRVRGLAIASVIEPCRQLC